MIHTSNWKPRVYPYNGDIAPAEIDRLQDLTAGIALNREKIREIGRDGIVDWRKRIPATTVTARQYEYGSLEFYQKLTNNSGTDLDLDDFKTSMVDICGYKTDDDATFLGTVWYPKLRVSGFSVNIGDPQAYIERTFNFVGEDEILLKGNNKYFIYRKFTASGGTDETFVVSDGGTTYPDPVEDPDNSSYYLLRVLQVSGSTTTELTYDATPDAGEYSYVSGTKTLTVGTTTAGDVIKVYWSAASYITGTDVFTNNDSDMSAIIADSASIYLYVSANQYVYKLQSVGVDVTFDRADYYEIGNDEVVSRGVRDQTVRITLGRILEQYTIEEVLRGESSTYGKINAREYLDDTTLRIKLYSSDSKGTFKIGYKFTDLSPTNFDIGVPLNDYANRGVTLETDNCTISTTEGTIDA